MVYSEIAEGFAVVAALSLLLKAVDFSSSRVHPHPARKLAGMLLFSFMALAFMVVLVLMRPPVQPNLYGNVGVTRLVSGSAISQLKSLALNTYRGQLFSYRIYTGVIGFALVLAGVGAVASATNRLSRNRVLKGAVLVVSVAGAVGFSALVVLGEGPYYSVSALTQTYTALVHLGINRCCTFQPFQPQSTWKDGEMSVLVASITTIALTVSRLDEGILRAFKWALKVFVLPAIMSVMAIIYFCSAIDGPFTMTLWAVNAVSGLSLGGIPLLSNWTVLVVSLSLFIVLLLEQTRPILRVGVSDLPGLRPDYASSKKEER